MNSISSIQNFWNQSSFNDAKQVIISNKDGTSYWEGDKLQRDIEAILKMETNEDLSDKIVLDYGCGIGRLIKPLSKTYKHCYGVDIAQSMLDFAKIYLQDDTGNITLDICNGKDLCIFENNFIDIIYSFLVFQHIPTADMILQLLQEFNRILKKDGYCCIMFSNKINDCDVLAGAFEGHRPSKSKCNKFFQDSGFSAVYIEDFGSDHYIAYAGENVGKNY